MITIPEDSAVLKEQDSTPVDDVCNYDQLTDRDKELINDFCNTLCEFIDINDGEIRGSERTVQFWAYLSDTLCSKKWEYNKREVELDKQKLDLEHFSEFCDIGSIEHSDILQELGTVIRRRRIFKNITAYFAAASDTVNKISKFVRCMTTRKYTPRSLKYRGQIDGEPTTTTIKLDDLGDKINKFMQ